MIRKGWLLSGLLLVMPASFGNGWNAAADAAVISEDIPAASVQVDEEEKLQELEQLPWLWFVNQQPVDQLAQGYQTPIELMMRFQEGVEPATVQLVHEEEELPIVWQSSQQACIQLLEGSNQLIIDIGHQQPKHYEKTIVIDSLLPKSEVLFQGQPLKEFPYADEVSISIQLQDQHLDVQKTRLQLDGEDAAVAWEMDKNGQKATLIVGMEGKHELVLAAQDLYGNQIEEHYLFVIDQQIPALGIMVDQILVDQLQQVYAAPPDITFFIKDQHPDLAHSWIMINNEQSSLSTFSSKMLADGSYSIQYHLQDLAGHSNIGVLEPFLIDRIPPEIQLKLQGGTAYLKEQGTVDLDLQDQNLSDIQVNCWHDGEKAVLHPEWIREPMGAQSSLKFAEEGEYTLEVIASDIAGHLSQQQLQFVIDHRSPSVETTLHEERNSRLWTIAVSDRNPDQQHRFLDVFLDEEAAAIPVTWKEHAKGMQAELHLYKEGVYRLSWQVQDLAGNQTTGEERFLFDRTEPIVAFDDVSYWNTGDVLLGYHVFDQHPAEYTLSILYQGDERVIQGTGNLQDAILLTTPEQQEGRYELLLSARDQAGNQQQIKKQLLIDRKAPEVDILLNQLPIGRQPYLTNQDVFMQYSCKDAYLSEVRAELWKDQQQVQTWTASTLGEWIRFEAGQKHTYELIVTGRDEAGNLQQQRTTFTIDRSLAKPSIANDVFQGKAYHGPWIPELTGEGSVFEVVEYALWKDGKRVPYQWKQEIKEDGSYQLAVAIRDQAMNTIQLAEIFTFTIDQTPPAIKLYDQDHQWFPKDQAPVNTTLLLYLEQQIGREKQQETFLEVLVNGISMRSQLQRNEQGQQFLFLFLDKDLHIQAQAIDEAGNISWFDQRIQPVQRKEVAAQIQEDQLVNPKVERSLLPSAEKESKDRILLLAVLLLGCVLGIYGIRRLSAYRHQ